MKALVYHGPGQRSWDMVPDPTILEPTDAIVRIDTATIDGDAAGADVVAGGGAVSRRTCDGRASSAMHPPAIRTTTARASCVARPPGQRRAVERGRTQPAFRWGIRPSSTGRSTSRRSTS